MGSVIPLFPLGSVLFPGLALPLHIFEDRYRRLVADLSDGQDEASRSFGVVAIRAGHEVGARSVQALHEVGTTAVLRRVTPYPDGRYDVLTSGSRRFRLRGVDESGPYLRGEVEWLDEAVGDEQRAAALASAVAGRLRSYRRLVGAEGEETATLPDDPTALSYLAAATIVLDSSDRQRLLATPTTEHRLRRLAAVLAREQALVRALSAVPATDLLRAGGVPN